METQAHPEDGSWKASTQRPSIALQGLLRGPIGHQGALQMTSSQQLWGPQAVFSSEVFWLGGRWDSRFSLHLSRSWKYG